MYMSTPCPPSGSERTGAASAASDPPNPPPKPYTIRGITLDTPLVQTDQLKTHLCLLRAFKDLRTLVQAVPATSPRRMWPKLARELSPAVRWRWFVEIAVDRFLVWLMVMKPLYDFATWVREELPPIDVLMVWHAYLLNPSWYAEDCDRLGVLAPLRSLDPSWFLRAIDAMGDVGTYAPSPSREASWVKCTGTAFDPLLAAANLPMREMNCPKCTKTLNIPYLTSRGTGYAQAGFCSTCVACGFDGISRESLGVLRFARDAVRDPENAEDIDKYGLGRFQAGTLRTARNPHDIVGALEIKKQLRKALAPPRASQPPPKDEFIKYITEGSGWSLAVVANHVNVALQRPGLNRVMAAYTDDRPFSVELVGAVVRQCSFIDRVHSLGWTASRFFDDNEDTLTHAVSRYHAFLDLLNTHNTSALSPTLDIKLAWQTHQLLGATYNSDCLACIAQYLDRDTRVEAKDHQAAFDATARVWKARFGTPYVDPVQPLPSAKPKPNPRPPTSSPPPPPPPPKPDALKHSTVPSAGHHVCKPRPCVPCTPCASYNSEEEQPERTGNTKLQVAVAVGNLGLSLLGLFLN